MQNINNKDVLLGKIHVSRGFLLAYKNQRDGIMDDEDRTVRVCFGMFFPPYLLYVLSSPHFWRNNKLTEDKLKLVDVLVTKLGEIETEVSTKDGDISAAEIKQYLQMIDGLIRAMQVEARQLEAKHGKAHVSTRESSLIGRPGLFTTSTRSLLTKQIERALDVVAEQSDVQIPGYASAPPASVVNG